MGKQTDRVFHLTVAALAVTLAAISVGTMVYQNHPKWIHQLLTQGSTKTLPKLPGSQQKQPITLPGNSTNQQSGAPTGNSAGAKAGSPGADVAYKPAYHMGHNSMLIQVKGGGSDVTAADVKNVQGILSKYNIVNIVSESLQMNVYQEIHIILAKSSADYQKALSNLGVSSSDAKQFTLDTGGFTQGDTIIIPLYQNKTTGDLANTLSHELTHAFLNANVGTFPSWMNEGLAVTNGMAAQYRAESHVEYNGYARQMAESILAAERKRVLWPLESNEAKVLSGTASYDLELQDWLAVRDLVSTYGYNAFSDYFYRLNLGEPQSEAFQRSFHQTEAAFNTSFTSQLRQAAQTGNDSVQITFTTPSSFKGAIRFLQHGTTTWTGFRPKPGRTVVTISGNGSITPKTSVTTPIQDSNAADPTTLYINLDPTTPLTYDGQKVKNSGFAIDYHYGMYGFVNGWITLSNEKSLYFHSPSLFGVTMDNIKESAPNKWFVGLLAPPPLPKASVSAVGS